MVSALDDDIGKILNILTYHGIYQNSVILFTADVSDKIKISRSVLLLSGCNLLRWIIFEEWW